MLFILLSCTPIDSTKVLSSSSKSIYQIDKEDVEKLFVYYANRDRGDYFKKNLEEVANILSLSVDSEKERRVLESFSKYIRDLENTKKIFGDDVSIDLAIDTLNKRTKELFENYSHSLDQGNLQRVLEEVTVDYTYKNNVRYLRRAIREFSDYQKSYLELTYPQFSSLS